MSRLGLTTATALACALGASTAHAAGTLLPASGSDMPLRIVDHHVEVVIDNGYARTEVTQLFENPNASSVEAIYTLPLPERAALSEVTIAAGDRTLYGEVVPKEDAADVYAMQQASGAQAGLAVKQGYQRFELRIGAVPAGEQASLTFVYYETLTREDDFARYLYPFEEGGTDPQADAFWTRNDVVDGSFSAHVTLRSAAPIDAVRVPQLEDVAEVDATDPHQVEIAIDATQGLDRDLIVYYRLQADEPGRVELIPYRDPSRQEPGTFMLVLTPGVDLAPLPAGADHVLVLDVSGSMDTKLPTLKAAAAELIDSLSPGDRYRIVKFSDFAADLTGGFIEVGADGQSDSREASLTALSGLHIEGGTNLYAGLSLALQGLDTERATEVLLVTDGVANEGLVDGPSFAALLAERDVRVFGFLMGNSGNWPLMQLLAETSGGFYAQVSNGDDIGGQMMLARNRMTHAALHDFDVRFSGGGVHDLTHTMDKVFYGYQVVVLGHYDEPGPVQLTIDATITGEPHHYEGRFELPESDLRNPELERLWAFAQVHWLEQQAAMQLTDAGAAAQAIESLGVQYQLVTDETSMIVLSEEDFERYGIDPLNRERSAREEQARELRAAGEPVDHAVPFDPAFTGAAGTGTSTGTGSSGPSGGAYAPGTSSGGSSRHGWFDNGSGGGALGADDAGLALLLAWLLSRKRRSAA